MITGNLDYPKQFKKKKQDIFMEETIVDEETFLASFGEYNYRMAKKYLVACELNKQIKNFSEIARQLNCSPKTVCGWLRGRQTPTAIRALTFLKSIKLMPLKESFVNEFILFTDLAAFLFGDGHLNKQLGSLILYGQKTDLENISIQLNKFYSINSKLVYNVSNSTITKIKNGVIIKSNPSGFCWRLPVNNSALTRLFYLAGVPAGDKVSISTRVPEWVMNGNKDTKRTFLSVLFGNELQCPYLRAKNAFSCSQFALHKIERKEKDLRIFLLQLKSLLKEFGISSSHISSENCRTIKKSGEHSMKLYFSIDSRAPNILRLFKELPFKYAEEKQTKFANFVKTFLQKSAWLKQEWKLYEKVIKLHNSGLGRRTIFKKLQLPKKYFYKINAWIHYGQKPLYYTKKAIF